MAPGPERGGGTSLNGPGGGHRSQCNRGCSVDPQAHGLTKVRMRLCPSQPKKPLRASNGSSKPWLRPAKRYVTRKSRFGEP